MQQKHSQDQDQVSGSQMLGSSQNYCSYRPVAESTLTGLLPSATVPSIEMLVKHGSQQVTQLFITLYDLPEVISKLKSGASSSVNVCPCNHCQKLPTLVHLAACKGRARHLLWHDANGIWPVYNAWLCAKEEQAYSSAFICPWSLQQQAPWFALFPILSSS